MAGGQTQLNRNRKSEQPGGFSNLSVDHRTGTRAQAHKLILTIALGARLVGVQQMARNLCQLS